MYREKTREMELIESCRCAYTHPKNTSLEQHKYF
ncbi:hypothetical protein E2C01_060890 [Portunus trituberculatus]|uniref:Uncharacterized protein n=1 Tax=Portunus trituberculatus TaxID=210409 RepID=A0A5B7HCW5_PORTR|nr:hypothetical protein [Portunus trituberculatus]